MTKLTNKNTSEISQIVTPLPLQLTCSTDRCATTTQINLTIYHSFFSCHPLAAPQNMSPTRTGNPIQTLMKYLTSQTEALPVLVSKSSKHNLN